MGINIDPMGDQKSKIFFNFGRNYWAMPLDAAIRQLGNEQDDTGYFFAPVIASDGTITVIPDAAHTLNGTAEVDLDARRSHELRCAELRVVDR